MCFFQFLSKIEPLILLFTLGVLVWYACETRRLRKATVEHNNLLLKPCLTIKPNISGQQVYLQNIGISTAIEIFFDDLEIKKSDLDIRQEYHTKQLQQIKPDDLITIKHFLATPFIQSGETAIIKGNIFWKTERINMQAQNMGYPFYGVDYEMSVYYKNINMTSFYSKILCDSINRIFKLDKVGEYK